MVAQAHSRATGFHSATHRSDWQPNPTLEEVGRLFDETRRRIREIEERALKKLRNGDGDEPAHS